MRDERWSVLIGSWLSSLGTAKLWQGVWIFTPSEGNIKGAAEAAAELVRASTSDEDRGDAFTRLARLEKQRGQPGAAAQAYAQAITIVGLASEAAKEHRELLTELSLLGDDPPWPGYVEALKNHLESHPEQPPAVQAGGSCSKWVASTQTRWGN